MPPEIASALATVQAANSGSIKQALQFLALAFAICWAVWIAALKLGAGVGADEYILAFGSAGPAIAAIFLSRRRELRESNSGPALRVLKFAVIWLLAWPTYLLNDRLRGIPTQSGRVYFIVVGALALIPAWILSGAFSRDAGVRDLLRTLILPRNLRWQAVALLFFPAFLLVPASIVHFLGGTLVWPQPHRSAWSFLAFAAVFFLTNFLFTSVMEEPGWRGFLLPRLQQRFSPLLATILVWLPSMLWHIPLDLSGSVASNLFFFLQVRVLFAIPVALILTWLYNRSAGNLLAASLFHASMNTFPFILPYSPKMLGLLILFAIFVVIPRPHVAPPCPTNLRRTRFLTFQRFAAETV